MNYTVYWSPSVKDEYAELLAYIELKHGLDAALKFMDKTDEAVMAIATFPKAGTITTKNDVRKVVITKHHKNSNLTIDLNINFKEDLIMLMGKVAVKKVYSSKKKS